MDISGDNRRLMGLLLALAALVLMLLGIVLALGAIPSFSVFYSLFPFLLGVACLYLATLLSGPEKVRAEAPKPRQKRK